MAFSKGLNYKLFQGSVRLHFFILVCCICLICNTYTRTALCITLKHKEMKNNGFHGKGEISLLSADESIKSEVAAVLLSNDRIAISSEDYTLNKDNKARLPLESGEVSIQNSELCFSTSKVSEKPWWRLDLEHVATIDKVKIRNRADCCEDELSNFYVIITNENKIGNLDELKETNSCDGRHEIMKKGTTLEVSCGNKEGRYIYIYSDDSNSMLTICKVEVYGMYSHLCEISEPALIETEDKSRGVLTAPVTKSCHIHAKCIEDKSTKIKVCECNEGYEGDGLVTCVRSLEQFDSPIANVLLNLRSAKNTTDNAYLVDKRISETQVITKKIDMDF